MSQDVVLDAKTVEDEGNLGCSEASTDLVDLSRQGSLNLAGEGVECQGHDHQQRQLSRHYLYS